MPLLAAAWLKASCTWQQPSFSLPWQGRVQHEPLGKALKEYARAKNRPVLLSRLVPIQRATEGSALIKELVESGEIYHPLAWSPSEAYRLLQDIPVFEESGLIVRVPDWWKSSRPPCPTVNVKIDAREGPTLTVDALLDFSVNVTLDGEPLTEGELKRLLQSVENLVALRGKWGEVDREKLANHTERKDSSMGYYYGFRTYVSVAQRRPQAQREIEKKRQKGLVVLLVIIDGRVIARTFWGKAGVIISSRIVTTRTASHAAALMSVTAPWSISKSAQARSQPWSAVPSCTQSRSRSHPCPSLTGPASKLSARAKLLRWSSSCKLGFPRA